MNNENGVDPVVVLDYGAPRIFPNAQYGATLFGSPDARTEDIKRSVLGFALGWTQCSASKKPTGEPHVVTVGVGTSNDGTHVGFAHGAAWGRLVNELNGLLASMQLRAVAVGANDIELDWNTFAVTKPWIDGYHSTAQTLYFHYGDAAGCPQTSAAPSGPCNNGWTQDNVWSAAWGATLAHPIPQIYNTSGAQADQWHQLSRLGALNHGARIGFTGTMTQYGACQMRGGCAGIDNTPDAGYTQLQDRINADPQTAHQIQYKTDISWLE